MSKRTRKREEIESLDVFQSFTDLMSNAFLIMSFFLLLVFLQTTQLKKDIDSAQIEVKNTLKLQTQLTQLKAKLKQLERDNKQPDLKNAAPIIIDQDSVNFDFPSGSAELNPQLRNYLNTTVAPNIEKILQEQPIEFIQVIGHTDGQAIKQASNLDARLKDAAEGKVPVTALKAGSNTDLGLMRAIAVLQELKRTGRLNDVSFRAYSAGQLYLPSGELATENNRSDASRRRIEIRFIPPGKTK